MAHTALWRNESTPCGRFPIPIAPKWCVTFTLPNHKNHVKRSAIQVMEVMSLLRSGFLRLTVKRGICVFCYRLQGCDCVCVDTIHKIHVPSGDFVKRRQPHSSGGIYGRVSMLLQNKQEERVKLCALSQNSRVEVWVVILPVAATARVDR